MIIRTKELYEIGWYVFKLFAAYRIISTICAVIFTFVKIKCDEKEKAHKHGTIETKSKIADNNKVQSIVSNYQSTRIGFTSDDTISDNKEP